MGVGHVKAVCIDTQCSMYIIKIAADCETITIERPLEKFINSLNGLIEERFVLFSITFVEILKLQEE